MESRKYRILVEEIADGVDKELLKEALSTERKDRRVDMELRMLRDSVGRSSLGVYRGEMFHFGGRKYDPVGVDDFGNVLYDVMIELGLPMGDFSKIESVIRVCRRMVNSKELRVNNSIVVFRNCVYDVRTGKKHRFSKEFVQMSEVDYDYRPGDRAFNWEVFLTQVIPNKIFRGVLQEFIGSVFINRTEAKMESMLVLIGTGANGKSVVFETVLGLLGRENVTHFSLDELVGYGVEKKRNIATMNGRRLNYASETGHFVMDGRSGVLKALISGEPVEARAMYGDNFTARELPMLMINCNRMPDLKDFSRGLMRRLTMIPFEVEIPASAQNTELARELECEYPGIFNWAMEGRKRFIANGYKLTKCDALIGMVEDYQANGSSVLEFMRSRLYFKRNTEAMDVPPIWKDFSKLYDEYHMWAVAHNEEIVGYREASNTLMEFGFKKRRDNRCTMFALYGREAEMAEMKRRNEERLTDDMDFSDAKIATLGKEDRRRMRRWAASKRGWDRVVIGSTELNKYLRKTTGAFVDVNREAKKGKFDGMYDFIEGAVVYNLDLIDNLFLPELRDKLVMRANTRDKRLKQQREEKILKDYELNMQFNQEHNYTKNGKTGEAKE